MKENIQKKKKKTPKLIKDKIDWLKQNYLKIRIIHLKSYVTHS